MCVYTARMWSCAALPAQYLLSALPTVKVVLSLLGQYPLTDEGAALTHHAVASAHTVAAHASARLQQAIIIHAGRRDVTTRRLSARRAQ
jgi:hypothetical protein